MFSIQDRLFGKFNTETCKAEILPCKKTDRKTFEAQAKSAEMKEVAEKILQVVNKEMAARASGNEAEAKRLHDEVAKLKKKWCRVYCFQGTSDDEHRVDASWRLNGQYMADFDDVDDVDKLFRKWAEQWLVTAPEKPPLSRMAEELELTYIGRSISTRGIRVVGICKIDRGTPFENAQWLGRQLGLEVSQDNKCKDLCRASFGVPWNYIEYISDELFEHNDPAYDARYNKRSKVTSAPGEAPTTAPTAPQPAEAVCQSAKVVVGSEQPVTYLGIPIEKYIDMYWTLFNKGKTPTQGGRNTLTFELCCELRHILDFDRQLLKRAVPSYDGLSDREREQIIDSALSRERGPMPYRMREVLKAVQAEYADNSVMNDLFEEMEERAQKLRDETLRRALPFGVKDCMSNFPQNMLMPGLTSLFPNFGAQATWVRLDIHNEGYNTLNLQAYIVGSAASNKGMLNELFKSTTKRMKQEDDLQRKQEEEYAIEVQQAKNKKDQPPVRFFSVHLQALRTSVSEILYRLKNANGRHLLSFTPESDQLAFGQSQVWSNMSVILRCAYDGSTYSQDFRSETSTRAWIENVKWNVILCGTPDALYRMYPNYEDGTISRILLSETPDNTYSPLVIRKKLTAKAEEHISQLTELLPLMQGDLLLPRLEKVCQEWLEQVRIDTMKNDDKVRARFRFRIAVSTMRCVAILMLCDFAGWLLRELDNKEEKPEWAKGCTTAAEYLTTHPEATAYWLPRKFQKKQLLDTFNLLADYYLDESLRFFRTKVMEASKSLSLGGIGQRSLHGRNDSIFEKLSQQFTLKEAQKARPDQNYDRTRSMLRNWTKAKLVENIGTGLYRKYKS